MQKKFLRSTIKAEPIIWEWYAWSYLIPPATAACNIVGRHLRIMDSYILAPQVHAQAVKNPKMLGGPFIDFESENVEKVKVLIDKTKQNCSELILFEQDLKKFDRILMEEAVGDSLSDFYARLPTSLGGMVELVYDLNNRPTMRLIEPLIYSKYYSEQHQSIDLSETPKDFRPFALSTPCIQNGKKIRINTPFSNSNLDLLFSAKFTPHNPSDFIDLFNISTKNQEQFLSFFSDVSPKLSPDRNYSGEGMRIRYFGHACVLLETKNTRILIDPVISYPVESSMLRYTYNDLPDHIDFVLITHNHQDHVMLESLIALRHKIGTVIFPTNQKGALADPSLKLILKHLGFRSLKSIDELENISVPDGEIIGLPSFGEHSDLNIQTKLSYSICLKDKKFLFLADSNNLDPRLYSHIFKDIGKIDYLFIGMECVGAPLTWLYGPLLSNPIKRSFDNSRTLSGSDFEKAWSLVQLSGAKHAYVYAMGQEPWLNYVMALKYDAESPQIRESNKFIQTCRDNGIQSERLYGRKELKVEEEC